MWTFGCRYHTWTATLLNDLARFYMNCAWVDITNMGGSSYQLQGASKKRQSEAPLRWPNIFVANIEGVNTCSTREYHDPVYPHPGADVVYAAGLSSASNPNSEACEVISYSPGVNKTASSTASKLPPSTFKIRLPSGSTKVRSSATQLPTASYTNIYMDESACEELPPLTITITLTPPSAPKPSIWNSWTTLTTSFLVHSSTAGQSRPTASYISSSPSLLPSPSANDVDNVPPYATSDVTEYLPCVPGTFLCIGPTAFLTCDRGTWRAPPRPVAAGMMCLPMLSRYTNVIAGQANGRGVPAGFYRVRIYMLLFI